MQSGVSVFFGNGAAFFNHILLEVVAYDLRLDAALHRKIIVQYERQIRFAASEIKNGEFFTPVLRYCLINKFNKAVYLLIFVVFCLYNMKIRTENALKWLSNAVFVWS